MTRLLVVVSAILSGILLIGVLGAARYRADTRWLRHDPAIQSLLDRHARLEESESSDPPNIDR